MLPVQYALYIKSSVSVVECQIVMCLCGLHILFICILTGYLTPTLNKNHVEFRSGQVVQKRTLFDSHQVWLYAT